MSLGDNFECSLASAQCAVMWSYLVRYRRRTPTTSGTWKPHTLKFTQARTHTNTLWHTRAHSPARSHTYTSCTTKRTEYSRQSIRFRTSHKFWVGDKKPNGITPEFLPSPGHLKESENKGSSARIVSYSFETISPQKRVHMKQIKAIE